MKSLDQIVSGLKSMRISNEVLYSIQDMGKTLAQENEEDIFISDCAIVPNYVSEGKRLELYEYEFDCTFVEKEDIESYLCRLTGKKGEEIPEEIRERQKFCHIELLKQERTIKKEKIREYIRYISDVPDIHDQIVGSFGQFDERNLYFEYYTSEAPEEKSETVLSVLGLAGEVNSA